MVTLTESLEGACPERFVGAVVPMDMVNVGGWLNDAVVLALHA